ncbi:hypothetical protein PVK06_024219 [Gossypium arboreum]|uniref:Uncharacterized protein n=1 Tax=Gossypium arboreum TaxID=29729 RepID=A0ABR0PD73_GOSAR|nr:hypothetical protein PVK06_024219 [Gossypium arboreum]
MGTPIRLTLEEFGDYLHLPYGDYFKSDRHPDLALILFNDIKKAIGRGMNISITLPHGTYFSYVFRQLGIRTHGDTPISSNQPFSYGILHHAGHHLDAANNTWMKHDHPVDNEYDDVDTAFDDIPVPELVALSTSFSHAA